jgi:hypothetical protein
MLKVFENKKAQGMKRKTLYNLIVFRDEGILTTSKSGAQ